jgi:hypothetical protein
MARYSDSALRSWKKSGAIKKAGFVEPKPARTLSETLGDRGTGSLLLERRPTGSVEVYFVLRAGGVQQRRKLGSLFDIRPDGQELGIAFWRTEAARISGEVREHGSIAAFEASKIAQLAKLEEQALAEAARGSFHDLFLDYVADRRQNVREDQITEFERILKVDLLGAFPKILDLPARDVRPEHIRQILSPIWERGAKRQAAKVRSFLRAAFAYGATAEHSLGRESSKAFGIASNPVDAVHVPDVSAPGKRALSKTELAHF